MLDLMSRLGSGITRKVLFKAPTDVFRRVSPGNERLSLAFGVIAFLAWECSRPLSATAARGTDVFIWNNRGIDRTVDESPRADGRPIPSVRAIPVLPLLRALLLGKPRPTTTNAAAGRHFGPACRELGFLGDCRRNPVARRGLVRLRTRQVPANPSTLPDSAAAPPARWRQLPATMTGSPPYPTGKR